MLASKWVRQAALDQWFTGKYLKQGHPAALEGMGRTAHVNLPDTIFFLAYQSFCFLLPCLQSIDSVPKRLSIMRSQALGIHAFQILLRHRFDHTGDMHQLAAGKNILLHKLADTAAQPISIETRRSNAVIQHQATGRQQAVYLAKIG
jgi:hypothetical protein